MKKYFQSKRNSGFTLVETLTVLAVTVILLAVSAVAVVYYRDYLKITELDNAAREIYLAAEHRAVLLAGSRQLASLVSPSGASNMVTVHSAESGDPDGGAAEHTAYYISQGDPAIGTLLLEESIDPALREGAFYILYEPVSGCVTDVFYAEEAIGTQGEPNFQAFYDKWSTLGKTGRMREEVMIGYYGGGLADGEEKPTPPDPTVTVLIENDEKLTVKVYYWLPSAISAGSETLSVSLQYAGEAPILLNDAAYDGRKTAEPPKSDATGTTYTQTWVLDALEDGAHFAELLGEPSRRLGGNFTVTATLTGDFTTAYNADSDNSLFAEESGDTKTAYLACLRHLQNLDAATGKDTAVQTAPIACASNAVYPDYTFRPIRNWELTRYDGGEFPIRDLLVTRQSASGKTGAGLFEKTEKANYENIRLVNASVDGSTSLPAGALTGISNDSEFQNCWVYWEPVSGGLQDLLGSSESGYRYQITGSYAGGLAGQATGGGLLNCLAATLVHGENTAGGLIGYAPGNFNIQNSYADCYLTGGAVAGLCGQLNEGCFLTLIDCYAAGFAGMAAADRAAGLCLGEGITIATNTYSVLRYPDKSSTATVYALTEQQNTDIEPRTTAFYLATTEVTEPVSGKGKSYNEMTEDSFAAALNAYRGAAGPFAWKNAQDTHPYNLQSDMNLTAYSFPGLKQLPHYGDWRAEFKEPSLVYYEQYGGNSYGFSGGNARYLIGALSDIQTIRSDGYAVAFLKSDLGTASRVQVTYTYFDGDTEKAIEQIYTLGAPSGGQVQLIETSWTNSEGNKAAYLLALLPEELVQGSPAPEDFFRYLSFRLDIEGSPSSGDYFYNPHFAETVIPYIQTEGPSVDWTASAAGSYAAALAERFSAPAIRTPRHLYSLSQFPEYYHNQRHSYFFHQELKLDYAAYTGYGLFRAPPFPQDPIGSWAVPFNAVYDGGSHAIKGVTFFVPADSGRFYAGLFGFSTGTLKNIVYEMDPDNEVLAAMGNGAQNLYVGALVGGNSGTVENCAVSGVRLTGYSFGATIYVGGLVGQNNGIIRACAAECALLSADNSNYAHAYVGGLAGENAASRSITASYAVGRINAAVDTTSDARICGFVGYNSGSIRNAYAAVDLQSSGLGVESYGFCGVRQGSQENTYYLNEGNFTYRSASYAANYTPRRAEPKTYSELTDPTFSIPGMEWVAGADTFPYLTAVKDVNAANPASSSVHYGAWPVPMELGEMGVFYWEKLKIGVTSTYHISLLAVDPSGGKWTVTKETTLSEAYDDGGIVTDYGYGYYAKLDENGTAIPVSVTAEGLKYTNDNGTTAGTDYRQTATPSVQEAGDALALLMPGFRFYAYRSFVPEENGGTGAGIYPTGLWEETWVPPTSWWQDGHYETTLLSPDSTLTLSQGGLSVTVKLNPHFAGALSVAGSPNLDTSGAPTAALGSADLPYGVRSVAQLEFINWNSTHRDTRTVLETNQNYTQFPYLSHSESTGQYYWRQSHDLDGQGRTYTPIAEYYDTTSNSQGNLYGWFGGAYNGSDYVIANVNIQGQRSSCAGLFGVVYNGTLENIILYGAKGSGAINSGFYTDTQTRWYAMGALAGLAAVDRDKGGSAVHNCAVAGYDINAKIYTAGGWGGSGTGGLVGISNMELTACSAVTDIYIMKDTRDNDNMRVGGLVGTCQQSITNCYAGGSITVDPDIPFNGASDSNFAKGLYIGGIVGGSYMKPLHVMDNGTSATLYTIGFVNDSDGATDNALTNCYSFVVLPNLADLTVQTEDGKTEIRRANPHIRALYALGGTGDIYTKEEDDQDTAHSVHNHGACTITNCYYMDSSLVNNGGTIKKENLQYATDFKTDLNNPQVTGLTYLQLANQQDIRDGQRIYELLNVSPSGGRPPYHPVTSQISGFSVAGKYSYAPEDRTELQGMDYPFPTVLSRDNDTYYVHYGEWPVNGVKRTRGGAPIALDLLSKAAHSEQLELSGVTGGGQWSVTADAGSGAIAAGSVTADAGSGAIAAGSVTADGRLTVQANGLGTTKLTVHYTDPDGTDYTLTLTVNVTAYLKLRPASVRLFPQDTVTVPLTPYGRDPDDAALEHDLLPANLTLTGIHSDSGTVQATAPEESAGSILLESGADPASEAKVTILYTYTHEEAEYQETDLLSIAILPLPSAVWENGVCTLNFTKAYPNQITNLTAALRRDPEEPDAPEAPEAPPPAVAEVTGGVITLKDVQEGVTELPLEIALTMDGLTHTIHTTVTVPAPDNPPEEPRQEGGMQRDPAAEQMEKPAGGGDFAGAALPANMHDGDGLPSDGGGLQRGKEPQQPDGGTEVSYALLGPPAGVQ